MARFRVGIAGAAGYTGGELIRILINHPQVEISFAHSNSNSGNLVSSVHGDLAGETDLKFADEFTQDIDVLFLCVGHGEAKKLLDQQSFDQRIRIIDLSQDFRLKKNSAFQGREFIYGLPELNREEIRKARNIANPGCFASSIELGLLPLAKAGLLTEVYSTGITGSTGAGQSFSASSHFSWRSNNIQAYKTLTHQHLHEIQQTLDSLQPGFSDKDMPLSFVPWRGDFTRGIFISSQLRTDLAAEEINTLYNDYFHDHPFVHISPTPIFLKQVVNTNKCLIQLEKVGTRLVIHSILDNLLKGASGQAVQNMNLMLGLEETVGLKLKANAF